MERKFGFPNDTLARYCSSLKLGHEARYTLDSRCNVFYCNSHLIFLRYFIISAGRCILRMNDRFDVFRTGTMHTLVNVSERIFSGNVMKGYNAILQWVKRENGVGFMVNEFFVAVEIFLPVGDHIIWCIQITGRLCVSCL